MRIQVFQHVEFEDIGAISTWAKKENAELFYTKFFENNIEEPDLNDADLLIVMGGPMSVNDEEEYPWLVNEKRWIQTALKLGVKVLGICLGAQLIASVLEQKVYRNPHKEIGWFKVKSKSETKNFFEGMPAEFTPFHWHGETFDSAENALHLFENDLCKNQGFIFNNQALALQFHLEATKETIENLIKNCGDELVKADFIQTVEEMNSGLFLLENNHKILFSILDQFISLKTFSSKN